MEWVDERVSASYGRWMGEEDRIMGERNSSLNGVSGDGGERELAPIGDCRD